jgi:glycosyltransferase involved in cell wall biosynthesis
MSGRVALLLPSLRRGGAERVTVNLARGFAGEGVPTDLVVVEEGGALREEVPSAVRIVDLSARRVAASLPALARYLRRERPQVLLAAMVHANVVAAWARWLSRAPTRLVVSEHVTPSFGLRAHRRASARLLLPLLMRPSYALADAVVAVSEGAKADLVAHLGFSPERIRVIYNPVVTPELEELGQRSPGHPWLEPGEEPVILGAGRLHPQKDFVGLIEAFALVRRQRRVRLIILGEGAERPRLLALAAERGLACDVDLPGFVTNPFAFMARARLFALSSVFEGLPGVLIQALAMGCPVVATDCPSGPAEILDGGRHGRLVPPGDPDALAAAILAALAEPPDRDAARRRAELFRLDRVLAQYREVMGV